MPRLNRSRNRNGMLFVGFVVVATLVAVVLTSQSTPASNTNTANTNQANTNVPAVGGGEIELYNGIPPVNTNAPGTITYENTDWGVKIHGVTEAKETRSGDILTVDFGGQNSLSILSPELEGIVRESVGGTDETMVTIDGVSGRSITGASAKDGSTRTLVLVEVNNRLFVFDGSDEFLQGLPSNVEFENI